MLKPARAKSWTVASCSEPFGIPSFRVIVTAPWPAPPREGLARSASALLLLVQRSVETGPRAGVAHVAVAEPPYFQQHGVVIAIDQDLGDRELVARGLAFHPQLVARAAEERREPGALRFGERDLVHETHHQD